jgi:hypothetical protein
MTTPSRKFSWARSALASGFFGVGIVSLRGASAAGRAAAGATSAREATRVAGTAAGGFTADITCRRDASLLAAPDPRFNAIW